MKKKFLIATCFFIYLGIQVNAQCPRLLSQLDDQTAMQRIDFFNILKKGIINRRGVSCEPISIDAGKLITVLQDIQRTDAMKNYDGVRVYFLIADKTNSGKDSPYISIVVIPTTSSGVLGSDNKVISDDDNTHAYVLKKDGTFSTALDLSLPANQYIFKWEVRYQRVISVLRKKLQELYGITIDETESIWYSKNVLFSKGPVDVDLLTYLTTDSCKITKVEINLGIWTADESLPDNLDYVFKTDLIFKFVSDAFVAGSYFTLGEFEIKKKVKDIKLLGNEYGDTGLPCPPNKCP